MEIRKKIEDLIGEEVVVIPKDGGSYLAEVIGVEGDKAIFSVFEPQGEVGPEQRPLNEIDDVFSF